MDISVIEKATAAGIAERYKNNIKIDEIPFDFHRRRMSVIVHDPDKNKTRLITKGAIEEMLSICTDAEYNGEIISITEELKKEILSVCHRYNDDGMRVLAVAQRYETSGKTAYSYEDEQGLTLTGYLAFLDPPKETAAAAIAALSEYGVNVKVLTGDNDAVTRCVCKQVGLNVGHIILGSDIERMTDKVLKEAVEKTNVFAKLSPTQKARIVTALRENGHTVGFMGDGINDAAAMKAADVGISVDTAVDIAKESANIILLEKDLMVLEEGIIEGRKIYGNIVKYIKMTASSNFGNMISVLAASAFIPFLPMLPIQILVLNLIYDLSCASIPWDNVDADFLKKPRKWEARSITKFMFWFGPISSIFDIVTYIVMYFVICPLAFGGAGYAALSGADQATFAALFQTGWFIESLATQMLVMHAVRSKHLPLIKTRASWQVTLFTALGLGAGIALPYIAFISGSLGMQPLGLVYYAFLAGILILYLLLLTFVKWIFVRRYKELL
jgi:Mg2+-importing ATPase